MNDYVRGDEIEYYGESTIDFSGDTEAFTITGEDVVIEDFEMEFSEGDDVRDSIGYAMRRPDNRVRDEKVEICGRTATHDIDAEEIVDELESVHSKYSELVTISGVGPTKADVLEDNGYETVEDVKKSTQDELAEIPQIGNALAARIKADVGVVEEKTPSFLDEGTLMAIDNE